MNTDPDADVLEETTWEIAEELCPESSVVTHDIYNVLLFRKHRRLLGVETTGRVLMWNEKVRLWTTKWDVYVPLGDIRRTDKMTVVQQYAPRWFEQVKKLGLVRKRRRVRIVRQVRTSS